MALTGSDYDQYEADAIVKEQLLSLVHSSRVPVPPARRAALAESCRCASSLQQVTDMLLESLSDSPYLPNEAKNVVMECMLNRDWNRLATTLQGRLDYQPRRMHAQHRDFLDFRKMALLIFYSSRKINQLNVQRRRRLGSAILSCSNRDQLMELMLQSLENAITLDQEARLLIADDVLEARFYRLLLPNRFDCEEIPRRVAIDSNEDDVSQTSSQEAAAVWMDVNDECPICLDDFDDPAELSQCHHTFCRVCLHEWAERDHAARGVNTPAAAVLRPGVGISCPLCRQTSEIAVPVLAQEEHPPPTAPHETLRYSALTEETTASGTRRRRSVFRGLGCRLTGRARHS